LGGPDGANSDTNVPSEGENEDLSSPRRTVTYLHEVEVDIEVVVEVSKDEITIVTCNDNGCMDREIIWIGKSMREVGDSRKLVGLAKVDDGGALLQRTRKRNPWIQVAVCSDMLEGDSEPVMSRSRRMLLEY
jgi:hypothetical protein